MDKLLIYFLLIYFTIEHTLVKLYHVALAN